MEDLPEKRSQREMRKSDGVSLEPFKTLTELVSDRNSVFSFFCSPLSFSVPQTISNTDCVFWIPAEETVLPSTCAITRGDALTLGD